jgi:hypothetical protein
MHMQFLGMAAGLQVSTWGFERAKEREYNASLGPKDFKSN